MQNIIGEFLVQIARVVFFIAVIIAAVKLGAYMAKSKKVKENKD